MSNKAKAINAVALIALAVAATVAVSAQSQRAEPPDSQSQPADDATPVAVTKCRSVSFEDRVDVSGTALAKDTALVSARISGTLDRIFVDEGDTVEAGRTELFETDKVALLKTREGARQQVAVAKAAVVAKEASVRRAEAEREKARIDAGRYRRLYENDHAVTKNALETQETRLEQLEATCAEIKANLELTKAQAVKAESALAIAEKNLSDALVLAPISGTISERMLEPGEYAQSDAPVVRIVDLARIEVSAFLPQRYYARVHEDTTTVHLSAAGESIGEFALTYKSPVIDPQLRTFEIKTLLAPPPEDIVPGRLLELGVVIESREGLAVPATAVLTRAGNQVIFVAEHRRARMIPITTGLQMDGLVEVTADTLAPGMDVITQGQRLCEEGKPVRIVGEGR